MPGEIGELRATFWCWRWDPAPKPLDVAVIANELAQAGVSMMDGPQALAIKGNTLRLCERQSVAVGKTPDARPVLSKPFAGFICSSLDLFNALNRAGTRISPLGFIGGVSEVYPGHIWTILANRRVLPRKSIPAGRAVRKRILEALGVVGLPVLPTITPTCHRMAVMQKLPDFVPAHSHRLKPVMRDGSQCTCMLFHPRIAGGISLDNAIESQHFRSHAV